MPIFGGKQKQLQQPATRTGAIHGVPCPHCGKKNDFRHLQEQQLLDTGNSATCDHCGGNMKILRILPVTMITVGKTEQSSINRGAGGQQQPTQQARTIGPGALQKLLGRGGNR